MLLRLISFAFLLVLSNVYAKECTNFACCQWITSTIESGTCSDSLCIGITKEIWNMSQSDCTLPLSSVNKIKDNIKILEDQNNTAARVYQERLSVHMVFFGTIDDIDYEELNKNISPNQSEEIKQKIAACQDRCNNSYNNNTEKEKEIYLGRCKLALGISGNCSQYTRNQYQIALQKLVEIENQCNNKCVYEHSEKDKKNGIQSDANRPDKTINSNSNAEASSSENQKYYELGEKYERENNYIEAEHWYEKAKEAGNNKALFALGYMYGVGTLGDLSNISINKSYEYLSEYISKTSNEFDYAAGKRALDMLCDNNPSICGSDDITDKGQDAYSKAFEFYSNKDYTKAIYWFKKSINQGSIESIYWLGKMYENGQGVTQSYRNAADLYEMASDKGHRNSQALLGAMYLTGPGNLLNGGVGKNISKAYKFFSLAAAQGDIYSKQAVKVICEEKPYICR